MSCTRSSLLHKQRVGQPAGHPPDSASSPALCSPASFISPARSCAASPCSLAACAAAQPWGGRRQGSPGHCSGRCGNPRMQQVQPGQRHSRAGTTRSERACCTAWRPRVQASCADVPGAAAPGHDLAPWPDRALLEATEQSGPLARHGSDATTEKQTPRSRPAGQALCWHRTGRARQAWRGAERWGPAACLPARMRCLPGPCSRQA